MPEGILVCITQQKTCERLIRRGSELKNEKKAPLYVIHVSRKDLKFLDNTSEGDALQYLFTVSSAAGANLTVLKSDDLTGAIVRFAKDHHINDIVMGSSPGEKRRNTYTGDLQKQLPEVMFHIVSGS